MIGTTLRHYRIERELGSGGMGQVYLAQDAKLHRRVALKVLPQSVADTDRLQRFQREAQAVAALNHPNVVTIYSVEEADGIHFLTMELVDGNTLAEVLTARGMSLADVMATAIPLVDAVAAAHQRGVIHRDLKPGNVMLTKDRRVKVLDFGLAKLRPDTSDVSQSLITTDHITAGQRIMGTPAYMSPEQAEGKTVDARSDIFSLGVMLYEMSTGRRPFNGSTAISLISSIIKDTPRSLPELKPDLPGELDRIVRRCLAKDPARRYQNAYDLKHDLEELQQQVVSGTTTVQTRRRDFLRWAAAALIVAAALGAFVMLYLRQRNAPSTSIRARFSQITHQPGVEWFPSLSPDGKWVIYSGEHSGNREIYLQSVTGQVPINLTNHPADDDQPAFSPDGERIVFRSTRDGGGLFIMGRTGEAVRRVSRRGFNPAWSPDGANIVYANERMELNPQNSEGQRDLYVVSANGGEPRLIFQGDAVQPNWSPHNRRIAFARRLLTAQQTAIVTIPAAGGAPVPVTGEGAVTDWNPVWSPDGRYLYFSSDRGGSMNLWRVAIDEETGRVESPPQPIASPAPFLAHISIARDGRTLVYSSTLITQNIQKLAFDPVARKVEGEPFNVTTGSRLWSSPDPAADGSAVVFYSRVQPEGDLYLAQSDGTGFRQVTTDPAIDRVPRWSPDGQWIACFSDRSGTLQIWKVRPDGSDLQQVTNVTDGNASMVVWSPDGARLSANVLAASNGRRQTYLVDPQRAWKDQSPEVLPDLEGENQFVANSWSADGSQLAGQAGFTQGIIIYSLSGRRYTKITDSGEWPAWLPDNRHILFVTRGKEFLIVDSRTKKTESVFSVVRDVIGPPRMTGDGRALFFSRRITEGDIWLVELEGE